MIDYKIEYLLEVNHRLSKFINEIKPSLEFDGISMAAPIQAMMEQHLMSDKKNYIENRRIGKRIEDSFFYINHYLDIFRAGFNDYATPSECQNSIHHPWKDSLKNYTEQFLIYIFNNDFLKNIYPIISNIPYNTLLLSEQTITENFEFNGNFTELPIDFTFIKKHENSFLERNFPFIYFYANTFSWFISILHPQAVILFEGNYIQLHILGLLAKRYRIPSILVKTSERFSLPERFPVDYCILPNQLLRTIEEYSNNVGEKS